MGMKRRGMGRRQVLNLNNDKQDSPRRTWQTKYQQICAEHNSHNGAHADQISSITVKSPIKSNPLSGLLGHYHSDSDTEDESKKDDSQLDTKVSDFLKEIQTIAPSETSMDTPTGHIPPVTEDTDVHKAQTQIPYAPTMAWQECYDENSGYAYYWNVETNEVTWEIPPEYQAYLDSIPISQEEHWMPQQHHMGMMPAPIMGHVPVVPPIASVDEPRIIPKEEEEIVAVSTKSNIGKKTRSKRKDSDSDDERIEMITSYGPASDESDEEEILPPVKKRKSGTEKSKPAARVGVGSPVSSKNVEPVMGPDLQIGPQPKPIGPVLPGPEFEQNQNLEKYENGAESPVLSCDVFGVGSHGDEAKMNDDHRTETDSQECQPDSSEDNKVSKSGADESESSCSPKCKTNELKADEETVACSGTSTPVAIVTEGESDVESGETDEGVILSRLRSRARILKELGGEIPDEVQHLIDPSTTSISSPLVVVEDVIAQIEKELPPDYKSKGKDKKKDFSEVSSGENSPRTSSFALIAGYGDDSDPEEDKKTNKLTKKRVSQNDHDKATSTLPVINDKATCTLPVINEEEVLSTSVIEGISSANTKEAEVGDSSADNSKTAQPGTVLFPSVANMDCVPTSVESHDKVKSSFLDGGSDASLPDSTTNNKTLKRKKRLDLGGVYPTVPAKPSSAAVQLAEVKSEKNLPSQSAVISSGASSSSVNYMSWTHYSSDPSSGVRRGFGFQSVRDEDTTDITRPDTHKATSLQKKGIINFIKADTLNPLPEEGKEGEMKAAIQEVKVENEKKEEEELDQEKNEMAQLISEKLNFLGEGKEPVSPVQIMSIQLQTLLSAWQTGALSRSYWTHWLTETAAELVRLEQVAAPDGWACEWDRTYKRYYYRNVSSGETQWEYPSQTEGDVMELCTTPPPPPPPHLTTTTPPPPPPPPPPPQSPPSTVEDERPKTPPTPPPPQISVPAKRSKKRRRKKPEEVTSSSDKRKENTGDSAALPPLPSSPPPLPPLPSELPPLPPSSPPPLPASPPPPLHNHESEHGQPLPPGVDPPELPYIVARPMSGSAAYPSHSNVAPPPRHPGEDMFSPPLPPQSPPDSTEIDIPQMVPDESMAMGGLSHPLQGQYVMTSVYQQAPVVTSSISAMSMGHAAGMEYGPVSYVGAMPMPMPMPASSVHVIAKPPAKKRKASLHAELDSFYSDLASLESSGSIPRAASSPPPPDPTPQVDAAQRTVVAPSSQELPAQQATTSASTGDSEMSNVNASETRKKKKTKLAPGLSLKKKGVSSLVAKWQQVQQEVRRDYKNMDNEDNVSSTHK